MTRVRRDDLLTVQVDGTHGSAVAGLRDCWVQHAATPRAPPGTPMPQPIDFFDDWPEVPDRGLRQRLQGAVGAVPAPHRQGEPFRWSLKEGAKGVQLAELGYRSSSGAPLAGRAAARALNAVAQSQLGTLMPGRAGSKAGIPIAGPSVSASLRPGRPRAASAGRTSNGPR